MTIQQRQLINEYSTQSKAAGGNQSTSAYLGVPVKDAFEVLVEVLDCQRTQLVEDAPHFPTRVILGSLASVGSHQTPFLEHAYSSQHRRVVVLITQQVAH